MTPKTHSRCLFAANMVMYLMVFLILVWGIKSANLNKEYLLGAFIFLLVMVTLAGELLRKIVLANCPKCNQKCKTVGRNPIYYRCTACDFEKKTNHFENGERTISRD